MNHGKFPANLVTRDRVIRRELRCIGDDVEIGKRGFDHDDVGTFGHITLLPSNQQMRHRALDVDEKAPTIARLARPLAAEGS